MSASTISSQSSTQTALYFVDAGLGDLDTLLAGLPAGAEVVLLDRSQDGLSQMLAALDGRSGIDALHILTHGAPGQVQLGNAQLSASTLPSVSSSLQALGQHLSTDADILFYGCDVAASDEGQALIGQIAELTGADVAASTDLTGSAALGGDWELEASAGAIEAAGITAFNFDGALALPGAHSAAQGSEVFLGGNYIELGISSVGSFGTSGSKPAGFYGTTGSNAVGMSNDADGFNNGTDLRIDYFLPGTPEERWAVGYNGSTTGGYSALAGTSGAALSSISLTNLSSGTSLGAKFTGTVGGVLKVEQTHTFKENDKFFKTVVTLTNTSGSTLTDVRFMRSFDPDNTVFKGGSYSTTNKVENTIAADGKAVVSATSAAGDTYNTAAGSTAKILFFSSDSRANVANFGFSNSNPYAMPTQAKGYSSTSDSGIAIMFKGGSLAAGASVSFEYFTSLDTADVSTTIAQIELASNPAPTFTTLAAPVDTVAEDTQVEITYADLAAQGNEADQKPNADGGLVAGTVTAFIVTSVTSGALKIGTDAGSATAWNPGVNDVIDSTKKAYWTPTTNSNGTLNAFKVVARDEDGLKSSTPVQAQVTVTAVNDAPIIASATTAVALPGINEDQPTGTNAGATVSSLFGPRFTDVDNGASMSGIVVVNDASNPVHGKWQYSTDGTIWFDIGTVASNNGLALSASTQLRFSPEANWHGTPGVLTVHLADNAYAGGFTNGATRDTETSTAANGLSTNTVNLGTTVASVNDLPYFTSTAGAASLTETAAYDNVVETGKIALATGSLTGTLAGADVEGAVTFGIRGGSTSGSTVTKGGFFGTLTLDTGTKAWTYTPGNFPAINALGAGKTATDTFEFSIIDSNGATASQALTITYTGTNDLPVVAASLADTSFNGNGSWSYQIPANAFTDAEGGNLSYTIQVVANPDGSGAVLDTITGITGENVNKPSSWLIFNEASRTLSGTPTATAPLPLNIKVTATDPSNAAVSDTFTVTLVPGGSDANPAPGNVAPTSNNDHIDTVLGTDKILAITDFGSFSDANGDTQSGVKITSLPASGTLKTSADGTNWTNVNSGDVISKAVIDAGHLKLVPGTAATSIGFQVGDGTTFSTGYTLSVDVQTSAVTFAASTVTTAAASTWTNLYNAGPLTGFSGTVRVVVDATGGTIKLADATGVTAITTGYGSLTDGTATSIAFEGTLAQVNAALQQLQGNLAANPKMTLNISAIKGGSAYNPENGHYYEVVTSGSDVTWTDARDGAAAKTFNGLTGYLATVTSATENAFILSKIPSDAWIGASDSTTEGTWKWVTGPEAGTTFSIGNFVSGTSAPETQTGQYANWNSGEPNDSSSNEDYAEFFASSGTNPGKWNDLAGTTGIKSYIVEYGGIGAPTEQASRTITLSATSPAPVLSIGGNAAYTENAAPKALNPALDLTDVDSTTLASATVTLSAGKVTGDVLALTNVPGTMGNILGVYDSGTGTLTLGSADSTATLAQWEAALKAVTFASTSDNPGTGHSLSWQVNDGANSSNVGTTAIVVTPVNDAPVATKVADQTLATAAAWSFDVDGAGNNLFADPEGQAITYSAKLADDSALPSWLSFDPDTHTFTGNPPAGTPYLNIKVIGTDASGAAGFTTFTLNLTAADNGASATNSASSIAINDTNGGSIALGDVLTASAPVDDDGYVLANVKYQWQVYANGAWTDIGGATANTYTLTQGESSKQVRAQAFYTDAGGYAEAPVSNALTVPAFNIPGTVTVNGSATPGETLVASLSDGNGIVGITPTYQWYRGDTSGAKTTPIDGATFSSYTLTDADGGKFVTVVVTYTDNEGTAETRQDSTDSPVQLGAVAPVAVNDSPIPENQANEAGGVDNATAGAPATGNVLTNDTDANSGDTKTLTGLRSGNVEGLGEIGLLEAGEYSVTGEYGTLRINAISGAYTYTVNQAAYSVEALNSGDSVKDYFNYTVTDSTLKSDIGVVEVTINGANDAISVRDIPTVFTAVEDEKTSLVFPLTFALSDPDNTGAATVELVASEGKLSAASSGGVTVTGNDSGTLTLSGTLSDINAWLKTAGKVFYTSSPNDNGTGTASITLKANDGVSGDVTLATVNVDVTATNDAPRLDLNASNNTAAGVDVAGATGADLTGNDHAVVFRPRGSAVQVVDDDVTITDIDGDTTLVKATVEITAGAWDNSRTIYETLSSTASTAGITITGNGTGAGGMTGATKLTLTGSATHAQYQAALKTIVYNNSNENAFAGNRSITIAVFDKETGDAGLESNSAAFTTTAANGSVAVGQMIYIDGTDTGKTVATVIDSSHFVASGPLPTLANNVAMSFWLDGAQVTAAAATAKAPLAAAGYAPAAATTTVQVLWTPVVDLNGNASSGVGYTTSYTEGSNGTYITSTDALITDQDGNLKTVTVTLNNAADTSGGNSTETLFMAAGIVSNLATNGIITTFYGASDNVLANGDTGVHKIVFSGNKDATTFQLGMREVQYKNTSENPSITPRTVTVNIVDQDNNTGVPASATLNIIPVNDAPVKGGDFAGALNEGAVYVFTTTDLNSTDVDNAAGTLKYVLTSATAQGTLFRDTNNNGVVDTGEALAHTADTSSLAKINAIAANGYFTQAEVTAGTIKYAHNGQNPNGTNATGTDSFGFKVVDGMEDYAFANIAANQAGTVTLTVSEVNDAATGAPVVTRAPSASDLMTPGEVLTADVSGIADADGLGTFSYRWKVSTDGSTWTDADGVGKTSANYTLDTTDQGKQVKVVVSFNDAFNRPNTLEGTASGTVAFTNTAGTGGVTITSDGSPQAGETLTADTSLLTDADGLGPVNYQWQVYDTATSAWVNIGGATGKTYTLPGNATTGAQYKAVVSYTDGRGNSESIASTSVTVAADINDAPSLTGTGIFPATTALFSDVAVTTVESGQTIKTLTLTVGGLKDGSVEKLKVDGVDVVLAAASTTAITGGTIGDMSYAITMAGSTATVTITHAGLTAAQTKTLIEGLALNGGTTAGLRVVTLTSLQDSGGTADAGHDTGVIGISATVDVGSTLPGSNTAPVSGGDLAGSVAEGGTVALATADLSASDAQQPGLKVILATAPINGVLFRDTNNNGIAEDSEKLNTTTNKTFALADIGAGRIKYAHNGSETISDSFTFNVSDGLALSDSDGVTAGDQATTFNITVNAVDDAPTLSATALGSSGTPIAFAEGATAPTLFSGAAASPVEAAENITAITVMVSGLRDGVAEKLVVDGVAIDLVSTAPTAITGGAVGGVSYSVTVTGGTAIVTLSKDATGTIWNGLIDGLAYRNTSENPTNGQRSVTLSSVTETGPQTAAVAITSYVAVTGVNDAPTLALNTITVQEGGAKTLTTTDVAAADVDTPLGSLTYTLSTAPTHGTVYIDINDNGVLDAGEALAANGSFNHTQLSGGKVRYVHDDGELGDSFGVRVSDGQGGISTPITMTVTRSPGVNDTPTVSGLGSDVLAYNANSGAHTLEQGGNALVSDPDSANFNNGSLRVSITFNRDPAHDVLSIANVGTGAGQIGISGANVSYAGTTIGSFAGGSGTNDLLVSFNASATPEAVSALIKAIQFANDQAAPTHTSRTVSFALNDGQADGQATPVAVNVNIATGVTPSISIANGFFVMENTQLVTALSATDPNARPITFSISGTVDATNNPDNGKFEIISGNLLRFKASPDYEVKADSGANNVYNVIVRATNDLGSYAEQSLAITVLDQNPENGVAVGDTSGPAFGYATVNGSSLVMTYTDASNLSTSNLPDTSKFAVKVGGSSVAVTNVAVNATSKTVTLTLASAVTAGQSVTVGYTDPTVGNDVAALQDAAGNDAPTLVETTAATNITPSTGGGSGGGGSSGGGTGGGSTGGTGGTGGGTTTVTNEGIPVTTVTQPGVNGTSSTTQTVDPVIPPSTGGATGGGTPTQYTVPLAADSTGNTVIQVGLPAGVGIQSIATLGENLTLRQRLVGASNPLVNNDAEFTQIVQNGIDQYVPTVLNPTGVTVRALTLTVPTGTTGAPAAPVLITGNTSAPSALVIDARQLPSGTLLHVNDVTFAVVIGAAHLSGGAGQNFVVGDDEAQYIVLGADDDTLHGGGGNDTVGSLGGNDATFGDNGDDIVFGGTGNDRLSGGAGNDSLNGGLGYDVATQSGILADYRVSVDGNAVVLTNFTTGEKDRLLDVERVDFVSGPSLTIAYSEADAAAQHLVTTWLGRNLTAEEGAAVRSWVGATAEQVAADFLALPMSESVRDKSVSELLAGMDSNPNILRLDVADHYYGDASNEQGYLTMGLGVVIDGAGGHDILRVAGQRSDFHLEKVGGKLELTRLSDGAMYSLLNTEMVAFDSGERVVVAETRDDAILARLVNTMLNRDVTQEEWKLGPQAMEDYYVGLETKESIFAWFHARTDIETLNNSDYVQRLYTNTYGRNATDAELSAQLGRLSSGEVDRDWLAVDIASSSEAAQVIGSVISVSEI